MNTSEYLKYADECMRAAEEAASDAERATLIAMAKTWAEAAVKPAPQHTPPTMWPE
jgi:hypothetical protein